MKIFDLDPEDVPLIATLVLFFCAVACMFSLLLIIQWVW